MQNIQDGVASWVQEGLPLPNQWTPESLARWIASSRDGSWLHNHYRGWIDALRMKIQRLNNDYNQLKHNYDRLKLEDEELEARFNKLVAKLPRRFKEDLDPMLLQARPQPSQGPPRIVYPQYQNPAPTHHKQSRNLGFNNEPTLHKP